MEEHYSPEEIAQRLKLDPETIRRWIRRGELPAVKVARQWRVSEDNLDDFLAGKRAAQVIRAIDAGKSTPIAWEAVKADLGLGG